MTYRYILIPTDGGPARTSTGKPYRFPGHAKGAGVSTARILARETDSPIEVVVVDERREAQGPPIMVGQLGRR